MYNATRDQYSTDQDPTATTCLQAALDFAALGIPAFPVRTNKKPFAGTRGLLDATTDPERIQAWWREWPAANVAVAGGFGLALIDVDAYKGASIPAGWVLPVTRTSSTPRGGQHLWFAYAGELRSTPELGGICIKAAGGYVVAPPSRGSNGGAYSWVDPHQPIATLPERVAQLIREHFNPTTPARVAAPRASGPARTYDDAGEHWLTWALRERATAGNTDRAGFLLAQQLLIAEANGERLDVWGVLRSYASQAATDAADPFTDRDISRWMRSAGRSDKVRGGEPARKLIPEPTPIRPNIRPVAPPSEPPDFGGGDPPAPPEPPEEPRRENWTDVGNAKRFVARHGELVRYVATWAEWLVWDGRRWKRDDTEEVMRRAKDTVQAMWQEVARIPDKGEREDAVKWIYRSENHNRLVAMLAQAQSEPEVSCRPEVFDADPWALNVANGTLDLRTGELRPHRQEDMLTKLAPVEWQGIDCTLALWDDFIDTVTEGTLELQDFLRRAAGYTLTGDTGEEKLFFAHGISRTGKSTFLEAMRAMLGDYAMTADFETWVSRPSSGAPRDDLADMVGARMVVSIEVDDGKKLAEGLVKTFTGGDTVKARHLYQRGFEFLPVCKLWLAANHAPRVDAGDDAMWNRILRIGFNHVMQGGGDKSVKKTLRAPELAGPAILAWAVRGCLQWQQLGLGVPEEVAASTQEYRASQDPLRLFVADCCELAPDAWTPVARLRLVYENWCKANGERFPIGAERFGKALARAGCVSEVRRMGQTTVRGWQGIAVTAEV